MEELALCFNPEALEGKESDLETIKEGTSWYRILPPYGTGHNGFPWAFHGIHWGLKDSNGNQIPVRCSYDREKFCPICAEVWDAEKQLKSFEKDDNSEAKQDLEEFVKTFRADKAYYLNALTIDGRVKKLKIKPILVTGRSGGDGKKAEGQLIQRIKKAIVDKKFDPMALDTGCWFEFTRTGRNFNTEYGVDFKRHPDETIDRTPISGAFPEVYEAIKAQLAGGEGPMFDVHTLYELRSSAELKRYFSGEPVPSRRRSDGQSQPTLAVGSLTPLEQSKAPPAAPAATQAPVAATPITAPTTTTAVPVVGGPAVTAKPEQNDANSVASKVQQQRERLAKLRGGAKN